MTHDQYHSIPETGGGHDSDTHRSAEDSSMSTGHRCRCRRSGGSHTGSGLSDTSHLILSLVIASLCWQSADQLLGQCLMQDIAVTLVNCPLHPCLRDGESCWLLQHRSEVTCVNRNQIRPQSGPYLVTTHASEEHVWCFNHVWQNWIIRKHMSQAVNVVSWENHLSSSC